MLENATAQDQEKNFNLLIKGYSDEDRELRFREQYVTADLSKIKNAMILGAFLFYMFFIWDRIIDEVNSETTHIIRGIVSLLIITIAFTMSIYVSKKFTEFVITICTCLASFALSTIYFILNKGFDYGAAGTIVVMLYTYSVIPIRFKYLVVFSILSVIVFSIMQILNAPMFSELIYANLLLVSSSMILGLIGAGWREIVARRSFSTSEELMSSQERVSSLLHSILPSEIVRRIEAGEKSIADSYSEVCIVFIDIVGFTSLANKLGPRHLVELLDEMFTEFDETAERFSLERIKTIGDAYMAVSGLDRGRENSGSI